MAEMNIEIEAQLDALADICCAKMNGDTNDINDRIEMLLKSILMSGYVRTNGKSLRADVEARSKGKCRDTMMHHHEELAGITRNMQDRFDKMITWESTKPEKFTPSKTANISSATDA